MLARRLHAIRRTIMPGGTTMTPPVEDDETNDPPVFAGTFSSDGGGLWRLDEVEGLPYLTRMEAPTLSGGSDIKIRGYGAGSHYVYGHTPTSGRRRFVKMPRVGSTPVSVMEYSQSGPYEAYHIALKDAVAELYNTGGGVYRLKIRDWSGTVLSDSPSVGYQWLMTHDGRAAAHLVDYTKRETPHNVFVASGSGYSGFMVASAPSTDSIVGLRVTASGQTHIHEAEAFPEGGTDPYRPVVPTGSPTLFASVREMSSHGWLNRNTGWYPVPPYTSTPFGLVSVFTYTATNVYWDGSDRPRSGPRQAEFPTEADVSFSWSSVVFVGTMDPVSGRITPLSILSRTRAWLPAGTYWLHTSGAFAITGTGVPRKAWEYDADNYNVLGLPPEMESIGLLNRLNWWPFGDAHHPHWDGQGFAFHVGVGATGNRWLRVLADGTTVELPQGYPFARETSWIGMRVDNAILGLPDGRRLFVTGRGPASAAMRNRTWLYDPVSPGWTHIGNNLVAGNFPDGDRPAILRSL